MIRTQVAFSLMTLATISAPAALAETNDRCKLDAWTPNEIHAELLDELDKLAMPVLPAGHAVGNLPVGRRNIVLEGGVVAQLELIDDVRKRYQEVGVYDAEGAPLFVITSKEYVCPAGSGDPRGLCRDVAMWTELQARQVTDKPAPNDVVYPFLMRTVPGGVRPTYSRYGIAVDLYSWHQEFNQELSWLIDTLKSSTGQVLPSTNSQQDRVYWALAIDARLTPYLDLIKFSFDPSGKVTLTGKVPSDDAYGAAIDAVRKAGFRYLDVQLSIDGRIRIQKPIRTDIDACY